MSLAIPVSLLASLPLRIVGEVFAAGFVEEYDISLQAIQVLISDPGCNLTEKEVGALFTAQKLIYGLAIFLFIWMFVSIIMSLISFESYPIAAIYGAIDSLIGAGFIYGMVIYMKSIPYRDLRLCDGYPEDIQVVSLGEKPIYWVKGAANQSVVINLDGYTDKCSESSIKNGYPHTYCRSSSPLAYISRYWRRHSRYKLSRAYISNTRGQETEPQVSDLEAGEGITMTQVQSGPSREPQGIGSDIDSLKERTCFGDTSDCWGCGIQICHFCQKICRSDQREALHHLTHCTVLCNKCFYKQHICRKQLDKHASELDCPRMTTDPKLICHNCSILSATPTCLDWERAQETMAVWSQGTQKCSSCDGSISKSGPLWWRCRQCGNECTDDSHHPIWAPSGYLAETAKNRQSRACLCNREGQRRRSTSVKNIVKVKATTDHRPAMRIVSSEAQQKHSLSLSE